MSRRPEYKPKYKLMYFNGKGRAEPSRYMFALAGVEYEDKRLVSEEWKELKSTFTLGHLPVLEVDGKQLSQSSAIHRFVAAELGFYGSSNWDRAQIDMVLETGKEMSPQIAAIFTASDEKDKLRKKLETEQFPKVLDNLEKLLRLNRGGDGWFAGDKVSLADVETFAACHDFYPTLIGKPPDLSKYEKLAALIERFQGLPQIAEWIKKRPVTNT